jgi:hypothetical protein
MKERIAQFNKWRKQAYITDNETILIYNILVYLIVIKMILSIVLD